MIPGEYIISKDPVIANENRRTVKVSVSNTGDRPIQVGSHVHFFETNRALQFPRQSAYGFHLNIPAGTSVRFEPGETKEVELCEYGGNRIIYGFYGLVGGRLDEKKDEALRIAQQKQFRGS